MSALNSRLFVKWGAAQLSCVFFDAACDQLHEDTQDIPSSESKVELSLLPRPEQSYTEAGAAILNRLD